MARCCPPIRGICRAFRLSVNCAAIKIILIRAHTSWKETMHHFFFHPAVCIYARGETWICIVQSSITPNEIRAAPFSGATLFLFVVWPVLPLSFAIPSRERQPRCKKISVKIQRFHAMTHRKFSQYLQSRAPSVTDDLFLSVSCPPVSRQGAFSPLVQRAFLCVSLPPYLFLSFISVRTCMTRASAFNVARDVSIPALPLTVSRPRRRATRSPDIRAIRASTRDSPRRLSLSLREVPRREDAHVRGIRCESPNIVQRHHPYVRVCEAIS